jgi:hypothetical protein
MLVEIKSKIGEYSACLEVWCEAHSSWSYTFSVKADLSHKSQKAVYSQESPTNDSGKSQQAYENWRRRLPDPKRHHNGEKQYPDDDLHYERQGSHPIPEQVKPLRIHAECANEPDPQHHEDHDGVSTEYSWNSNIPEC